MVFNHQKESFDHSEQSPAKKIKKIYIFALLLIGLIITLSQLLIHEALEKRSADARIINIAGRQRMLSQQIAKKTLLLYQVENKEEFNKQKIALANRLSEWSKCHNGLQFGDDSLQIPANYNSEIVKEMFVQLQPYFLAIDRGAINLGKVTFENRNEELKTIRAAVLENEPEFLRIMEEITLQYENEASQKIKHFKNIEIALMLIILLVLVLEARVVFRPIAKRIDIYFRNLQQSKIDLLNTNEKLKAAQKISKTGSWELDVKTNQVVWTEALYEMYGFDPSLPPPPYTEHQKLFTPKSWEKLTSSLALTSEQGIPYELELKTILKDGGNGWMWVRGEAVFDENNHIIGLRGIAQDITDKKRIELEKGELVKRLNYALDASGDGIWDWTPATGVTVFSKAWVEMLGYEVGELASLASEWSERLHPDDVEWVFAAINRVTQTPENGDTFSHEYRFRNKAGDYLWMLNKAKVVERNEKGEATRVVGTHTNITEHKRILEALKENERKLRNLTNNINESSLISITDEKGTIIEINRLFCELSGYTEAELVGQNHRIINSGYHDQAFWNNLWKTIAKGEIWRGEIKNRAKDGSEYWVYSVINPVKDSSGKIRQYISIRQDITDRKKTEFILQESEKKFRELFENLIDEVHLWKVIKDKSGKITGWQLVDANPPALKTWGKSIDEIIGKTANEIFGSDAHAQFMPVVEKIFATGEPYIWEEYFAATDQHLYMESIPFGDYFISTGKDVTEQRKVQQALKDSELRLSLAIQAGGIGVWDWDIVANILTWDDQMFALYGTKREMFSNAYDAWYNGVYETDRERGNTEIELAIKGEKEFNTEFRVQHPNGQIRNIRALATVVRDQEGNALRMIGTNWDITNEKEALQQIEEAKKQAEAASKAKSEFLANMSHELRTPLNGVIGFTDLLRSTQLSPVQQQYVNNANVSGHTLLGIINDILDFSKIEAGMLELEIIKTDMLELLENSVDIIKFAASEKGLELLLNIDAAMPRFAHVDPIRLKQILANLLGNAVKFTPKGEVELKVVFQPLQGDQGRLSIAVRDTGIGISEEQKAKLFKSFSQADSSTTRKFGGTGLGLVISEMIAGKMGSKINISSTVNIGSTFFFDIDTRFEEGVKLDTTQIADVKSCLIIDDNANNRFILEEMLKHWQIASDCSSNGLDALQKIEVKPYDVIICDYNMPYIDGLETIRMMKDKLKLSTEKQPVILLYSSIDNLQLDQKCKELGIRFRLDKPIRKHDLFTYLCSLHQEIKTPPAQETGQLFEVNHAVGSTNIIIAEDEPLNMTLSKIILSQLMPNSIIYEAKNGLEVIEQYKNILPDLIFMDVHMPELDGIEATKQIRLLEINTGRHTPIIALTAGVLKEEKDKCFAAGMDDFLTKPLEQQKILTVLNQYYQPENKEMDILGAVEANAESHFGYDQLVSSLGHDNVRQLIQVILEDVPNKINHLEQTCRAQDAGKIMSAAHLLKGSSLAMRCDPLAAIAEKMEMNANVHHLADIDLLLAELKEEWEIVRNILLEKMKY